MAEPYRLPSATVLAAASSAEVATVTIEISREDYLGYPVAPASLWQLDQDDEVFRFHQLVARKGVRLVFETYYPVLPLPQFGNAFRFCSWWIPNAMDAVRDTSAVWQRRTYSDNNDHDHCLLTYKTISAHNEKKEGYRSAHGWITVEASCEFIEQDRLRVRCGWRSIEWSA